MGVLVGDAMIILSNFVSLLIHSSLFHHSKHSMLIGPTWTFLYDLYHQHPNLSCQNINEPFYVSSSFLFTLIMFLNMPHYVNQYIREV